MLTEITEEFDTGFNPPIVVVVGQQRVTEEELGVSGGRVIWSPNLRQS